MSIPFDKRSEFFKSYFDKALRYNDFIDNSESNHKKRWSEMERLVSLTEEAQKTLASFSRKMNVLCLAGSWCGDCARQCPMLKAISDSAPYLELRLIDNRSHPELADELRICGGARVPTVVVLSEDFFEVSRYGDRTLSAYQRKAQRELGPACDSGIMAPPSEELAVELKEWVAYFERAQLILRLSPFLRSRYGD